MALDNSVIIARYEGILRKTPSAQQVASLKGLYATQEALDTALLSTAGATVNPIVLLYQSAFGRVPDAAGLDYWVAQFDGGAGLTLDEIGDRFFDSEEWGIIFDQNQPALIIQQLYQNILGRAPDAAGLSYWVNAYNNSEFTLAQIAVRFAVSDELTGKLEGGITDLLLDSADNGGALDPDTNLWDWVPVEPTPVPADEILTVNQDLINLTDGQTVFGTSATYTAGDSVTGDETNTVNLELSGYINPANAKITGVGEVNIESLDDTTVNTRGWTGVKTITLNAATANFTFDDLQESATQIDIVDANREGQVISINYDGSKAGFTGVANIGVEETFATIQLGTTGQTGKNIETINLTINDKNEDGDSTLEALIGKGTKTLNIDGGYEGGTFTIKAPLDATLTKIDASDVDSNLRLDTSKTFTALEALLGNGNDILKTGDTLGTGDVYDGGAGNDRLVTDFLTTNDPNRTPTIRNVETLEASFQAAVQLNGGKIDKNLATIDLNASAARADFNEFNSGLKTLNINGAAAQGVEVDYDGKEFAALTVNVKANAGNAGNKAALRVINADTVAVNFLAGASLSNGIQVDDNFAGRYTQTLSIVNESRGNAVVGDHFGTAVVDSNQVQKFTVQTKQDGDLTVGNEEYASLAEADQLQHLVVDAAANSTIDLGVIGVAGTKKTGTDFDAADDLETVVIKAADYATVRSWGIDADDSHGDGNGAATVTSLDVTGARSSRIELNGSTNELRVANNLTSNIKVFDANVYTYGHNWLQAASIGVLNIETAGHVQGSVTEVIFGDQQIQPLARGSDSSYYGPEIARFENLIGLDLESASNGVINVKGSGTVTGLWFEDEVVSTIDASGLTGKYNGHFITADGFESYFGADVANAVGLTGTINYNFAVLTTTKASSGFEFKGSAGNDYVVGTHSADVLSGGEGADFLIGNGGNDVLNGGAGADILVGDSLEAALAKKLGVYVPDETLVEDDYSPYDIGGKGSYAVGNDIIDGGAGNDIIIGGGQLAGGRDILTGGAGSDKFVFNFDENHVGANSESGKSTLQTDSVRNDIITDFTTGGDQIIIDVSDAPTDYAIAIYGGDSVSGWNVIGDASNGIQVIIRRGNYNDFDGIEGGGTFQASRTGDDFQVLFVNEAADFLDASNLVPPAGGLGAIGSALLALVGDGQTFFNAADHEIALLGAAQHGGSLATTDILFV